MTTEKLSGVITWIRAFRPPNWTAGEIQVNGDDEFFGSHTFAGNCKVSLNEFVTLIGKWENSERWGRQFKVTSREFGGPLDPAGFAILLGSHPRARGIGPTKARRLTDEYGHDLLAAMRDYPESVASFISVPVAVIEDLAAVLTVEQDKQVTCSTLIAEWPGLTPDGAQAIYAKYGGSAVRLMAENPYDALALVSGFGWAKADAVARSKGVALDHPGRVRAAVKHVVLNASERDGSTCLHVSAIQAAAGELLGAVDGPDKLATTAALELTLAGALVREDRHFALPWHHAYESLIRDRFASQRHAPRNKDDDYYRWFNPDLDESQLTAVRLADDNQMCVISGSAGTGKSTTINTILKLFQERGEAVALCAPTGKAARRIEEVSGHHAYTIHKMLGYNGLEFTVNSDEPLPYTAVIVDEFSMAGCALTYRLLDAMPRDCRLVLVGDHSQLPPVEAGAVLRDALNRGLLPSVVLSKCHRHAGPLKENCTAILSGVVAPTVEADVPGPWYAHSRGDIAGHVERLFREVLQDKWGYDPIKDTQIMTAIHKGPYGTRELNRRLQKIHQARYGRTPVNTPVPTIMVGDKVINTRNNYDLGVMNGHVGMVVSTKPLVVEFDDGDVEYPPGGEINVELAYCLTPHKAQGSEYPCVVVVAPASHAWMQHRAWIYTACTRARKTCVLLGEGDSLERAARKVRSDDRSTLLDVWGREASRGEVVVD